MFASSLKKADLKRVYEDPGTHAAVLATLLTDQYELDWIHYDLAAVAADLRDAIDADLPRVNEDKIQALMLLLGSDTTYHDPMAFNAACLAFDGEGVRFDVLDPASPEQMAAFVVEAALLEDPDDDLTYSDDVRRYMGVLLAEYGVHKAPRPLSMAILPDWVKTSHVDQGVDRIGFAGYFKKQEKDIQDIQDYVAERFNGILKQLDRAPLEHRDDEAWRTFLKRVKKARDNNSPLRKSIQ